MHIHPILTDRSPGAPRFSGSHGYRVHQDTVTLNADLTLNAPEGPPDDAQWALQLWACEQPYAGGPLHGIKVAETAIDVTNAKARAGHVNAQTAASLPTGARDYAMVMVLAGSRTGAFDEIQDFANYPARERFEGPELKGSVGYTVEGNEVVLFVDSVFNARQEGNLSGSLVLELRAHSAQGEADQGLLLARAELGCLSGQYTVGPIERRVPFSAPHAGTWNLSLQLREWAGDAGNALRDWCDFAVPYRREVELRAVKPVEAETTAAPSKAKPEPSLTKAKTEATSNVSVLRPSEPKAVPAAKATPEVDAPVDAAVQKPSQGSPSVREAAKVTARTPFAPPKSKVSTKPETKPAGEAKQATASTLKAEAQEKPAGSSLVSVSRASVDELAAVKGLNRRLASEIVRARPFKSLDELVKVRGIGPRMLKGLREKLEL